MALRISLAGRVAVEVDGVLADGEGVGRLGRLALAYLVSERDRPVSRHELAEVLWGEALPRSWETSLRVLVSKLRALLTRAGLPGGELLTTAFGCYQVHLPPGSVVDVEAAAGAVVEAEAALREGDPSRAREAAARAVAVASRHFLTGMPGAWVEQRQAELREVHLRALDARAGAHLADRDWAGAVRAAEEAIVVEPFRESAYLRLMQAHAGAGNRGEALRAYERCRRLLAEELGVNPSPPTEAAYVGLLGDERAAAPDAPSAAVSPPPSRLPSLPLPLTSFVGRRDDLARIATLLSSVRLLTLTGSGGVGKSRLALQAVAALVDRFPDGATLVELAPLADPSLVARTVLAALGAREEPNRSPEESVVASVTDKSLLLVLDNCEHVLAASGLLAERLLQHCPQLRILATSREPLRIPGETTWRVRSLSIPEGADVGAADDLMEYEAVQLLLDRVASVCPDLEVSADDARAAARICRELDGIPLALELAAARATALSLDDIAQRLGDRFRLLTAGTTTAPPRHQTLRAAVDWTYDALSATERSTWHRLSVFAGGFSLEAAEQVCAAAESGRAQVAGLVARLVEKSIVLIEQRGGTNRYRLPETMRHYGGERLEEHGDAVAARDAHLSWAASLAERVEPLLLHGAGQTTALDLLEAEQDNFRAALRWGTHERTSEVAARLAAALVRYWEMRGHFGEGRQWLRSILDGDPPAPPEVRARVLNGAGVLAQRQGDYAAARTSYEESLAIVRHAGNRLGMAVALHGLGNLLALQGDPAARLFFEECLVLGRELGDQQVVAASLSNLGWVAHNQGDFARARALDEESLELRRTLGDIHGIAMLLGNLGHLAFQEGDFARARALDQESLELRRTLGDTSGIAMLLGNLGHLAFQEGDDAAARALYEESLALRRQLGDRHGMAGSLANLAAVASAGGDAAAARSLLAQSMALADELGDRYRMASLLLSLGRLTLAAGDGEGAIGLFQQAIAAAGEFPSAATVAEWLEGLAAAAGSSGALQQAATLLGAASGLRRSLGLPVAPRDRADLERRVAACRDGLGPEAFERAWSSGRRMETEAALRYGRRADLST